MQAKLLTTISWPLSKTTDMNSFKKWMPGKALVAVYNGKATRLSCCC